MDSSPGYIPTVSQLDFSLTLSPTEQLNLLSSLQQRLRSMTFTMVASGTPMNDAVNFPCLEELCFVLRCGQSSTYLPSPVVPTRWDMPALQSLRIHSKEGYTVPYSVILPFVQAYGSRLLHLGIRHLGDESDNDNLSTLRQILEQCSNVRHLVLDTIPAFWELQVRRWQRPVFPNIRRLDISSMSIHPHDSLETLRNRLSSDLLAAFPSLERVILAGTLPIETHLSLPLPYIHDIMSVFKDAWSWSDGRQIRYTSGDLANPSGGDDRRCVAYLISTIPGDAEEEDEWLSDDEWKESGEEDTSSSSSSEGDDELIEVNEIRYL